MSFLISPPLTPTLHSQMSGDGHRLPSLSNQLPEHFGRRDLGAPPVTPDDRANPLDPSPKRKFDDPPPRSDQDLYGRKPKRSNSGLFETAAAFRSQADLQQLSNEQQSAASHYSQPPPNRLTEYGGVGQAQPRLPSIRLPEEDRWDQSQGSNPRPFDTAGRNDDPRRVQLPPIHAGRPQSDMRLPPLTTSISAEATPSYPPGPSSYPAAGPSTYGSSASSSSRQVGDPAYSRGSFSRPAAPQMQGSFPMPDLNYPFVSHERRHSLASSLSSPSGERPPAIGYSPSSMTPGLSESSSHYTWEVPGAAVDTTGRKRRGNLPKESTAILNDWFHRHSNYPYPKEEEKQQLQRETGLTMSQISNWFINARRRRGRPGIMPGQSAGHPSVGPIEDPGGR